MPSVYLLQEGTGALTRGEKAHCEHTGAGLWLRLLTSHSSHLASPEPPAPSKWVCHISPPGRGVGSVAPLPSTLGEPFQSSPEQQLMRRMRRQARSHYTPPVTEGTVGHPGRLPCAGEGGTQPAQDAGGDFRAFLPQLFVSGESAGFCGAIYGQEVLCWWW